MVITVHVPIYDDLLVKKGQHVDFDTVLVRTQQKNRVEVSLMKELGIGPRQFFQSLKKVVGETVSRGELLAEAPGLFAMQRYYSDHSGMIIEVNHSKGTVTIELSGEGEYSDAHKCFFVGEVVNVEHNKVGLRVHNYVDFPIGAVEETFGGHLQSITDIPMSQVTIDHVQNKIVCGDVTHIDIPKLEVLEARGIIAIAHIDDVASIPQVILARADHHQKIQDTILPYCLISKEDQKLYIYE